MLVSMFYLKDGVTRLTALANNCKSQADINSLRGKISVVIADMVFACEEMAFTTDSYNYSRMKDSLLELNRIVTNATDKDQLRVAAESAAEMFKDINYDSPSTYDFKRDCRDRAMRYVHTNQQCLEKIGEAIPKMRRPVQFLDTRCYDGMNLKNITNSFENKTTYGVEADQTVALRARAQLDRVAMGQFAGSRITNEAFDVLVAEPLINWIATFNGNQSPITFKSERVFLLNTIKYLRPNGIGIMILPYYKLYRDICMFIAKNYSNVQVRRLGADFHTSGSIVIMGTKREDSKDMDEKTYQLLRRCHDQSFIKDMNIEPLESYTLPIDTLPIDTFRGSVLDPNELLHIVQNSGCMDEFWKNQRVEKLSESSKQPLLPFNIGQIGLVLTSGCLDGIIDEGDGNYHLIKGKVSKQSNIERNYNSDTEIETQETISNRVEINVVLPNGDYKVLA